MHMMVRDNMPQPAIFSPADTPQGYLPKSSSGAPWPLLLLFIAIVSMPFRIDVPAKIFSSVSILDVSLWILGWLLLLKSLRDGLYLGNNKLVLALALPVVVAVVSFVWTADKISTFKYVCYTLTCVLAFYVTVNLFKSARPRWIEAAMALIVVLSLAVALLYWSRIPWIWDLFRFSNVTLDEWDSYERAAQFARLNHPYIGRSNDYATVLALFSMFFFGLALLTKKYRYLIIFVLSVLGMALTLSRGVLLSFGAVFVASMFVRKPSRILVATVTALTLVTIPLYYFVYFVEESGVNIIYDRAHGSQNVFARFERNKNAWELIEESPMLGYGAGRYLTVPFENLNSAIHNTYLEQVVSFGVLLGLPVIAALFYIPLLLWNWSTRNDYVKIAARFGAAGVVIYLLVCVAQTSNEAVMPRIVFHIYLGMLVAYLRSLETDLRSRPAIASAHLDIRTRSLGF